MYLPTYDKVKDEDGQQTTPRVLVIVGDGRFGFACCSLTAMALPYYDYYLFPFSVKGMLGRQLGGLTPTYARPLV
ncbi:hypothetical protein M434DRAFT_395382, partial [Hypoxylon sp. CO27-5]